MDYQRLADTVFRNQTLLRVDNDSRFGVVAYFRSTITGRNAFVKLLKNPAMNTKFILDKIASGLLHYYHPGLLTMVNPPQIPYGVFPASSNSKILTFEAFESDLFKLIIQKIEEKSRFTEAQLSTILRKVVATLNMLATHNLSHGNISPESILLIQANPKIVPSAFFDELGKVGALQVTPYSPPENISFRKNGLMNNRDPHKADIFSLGVTLLHAALLDQFTPIHGKGNGLFDENAITKNICKLSPKYSVTLVMILQRMTSVNLKNRPDLNQLSELMNALNDTVLPSSMTNSVGTTCFYGANRSDPSNSWASHNPYPTQNTVPLSRMEASRPPPVVTTPPKVAHLTLNIIHSPTEPCQSGPNSAKLPVVKSSPCKPMQHKLIASPSFTRSNSARKAKTFLGQSQQVFRLTRMETVAEVAPEHILLTETTPDKTDKKFNGGFAEIPEVTSTSSRANPPNAPNGANLVAYGAESQVLVDSLAESRVCSDFSNVAALKDLFNFFPQLRRFNSALGDAPLVEEEITKKSMMASQLSFSTAILKHRLVDQEVNKSGEKGVQVIDVPQEGECAPMAVSTIFQEGASPTSPQRRRDITASYAESRSNSNDTEEVVPTNIVREQYKDGSTYEGEKQFGKRHGYGTFNFKSGGQYRGAWFNGKMTGKGTLLYLDGSTAYEGEWLEGKFHGRGTLYNEVKQDLKASCLATYYHNFDDSNSWVKYEGGFSYDLREGTGTITFTDGSRFEGNFRGDKIDGYGKMHLATGELLEGLWVENRLSQILNASPSNRGFDTPCSVRSRQSNRSPKFAPGTPALGMMMSPLARGNRNINSILPPSEPVIKPKAC